MTLPCKVPVLLMRRVGASCLHRHRAHRGFHRHGRYPACLFVVAIYLDTAPPLRLGTRVAGDTVSSISGTLPPPVWLLPLAHHLLSSRFRQTQNTRRCWARSRSWFPRSGRTSPLSCPLVEDNHLNPCSPLWPVHIQSWRFLWIVGRLSEV